MSYPPQQPYRPPVVPGVPQSPAAWLSPPPPGPAKSRAVPILLGVLAVAVLAVGTLIGVLAFRSAPAKPGLTQAGAERACRTAFGNEWKGRAAGLSNKNDVLTSVQNIEMLDAVKTANGYSINGTIHYTLTAWPVDPVQNTLDLTCTATGSDAAPVTTVDNR